VAGLVALSVAVLVTVWLVRAPEEARLPADHPTGGKTDVSSQTSSATALLTQLTARLTHGTRRGVQALAAPDDPSAARRLGLIYDNVQRLGVTDLSMRYVDEDEGRLSAAQQQRLGGHAWVGDVDLTWRLRGYDRSDSSMEVTLTFTRSKDGAGFAGVSAAYGDGAPLWLLEKLAVEQSQRSLVAVADPARAGDFSAMADQAVTDVRSVLRGWQGRLVIEVPSSEQELGRVLDAAPEEYDAIAAVTTTTDGSRSATAPTHIFVNPRVFSGLGPRGAQIVLSHEATHVATGAATSSMPMWLLEGFADYVALAHVDLPASVTASQILARVRQQGPPNHLPGPAEFDPQNKALGASYEAAWLACRLLAQRYGEQKLIDFYRQADRDSGTDRAFRTVLGTDEPSFTRAWRDYLRRLAA
jgi:hypothetical protein